MVLTAVAQPEMQAAIDARHKRPQTIVWIGGIITDAIDVTVRHGVKEPIGTCTIEMHAPIPAHVTLGATVEVQMGYEQMVATVFRGRIPRYKASISMQGRAATISAVSNGNRLNRRDYVDVSYPGPISLKTLFQSVCARRKVEQYYSDDTTYTDQATGSEITIFFGNVKDANDKSVKVPKKTPSLQFLNGAGNPLGYYAFDTPNGMRQKKVTGLPDAMAAIEIREAWNAMSIDRDVDASPLANYIEAFGTKYTDADGVPVALRSIPKTLSNDPILVDLYGEGWARDERSSELLDTIELCDAARNVAEMELGTPTETVTWETHGAPLLLPGDVVNVVSDSIAANGLQWVMSVQHRSSREGFYTTCEGWRGGGVALPAGDDCVTLPIAGIWHIGDEYLDHYAIPSPGGRVIKIPFTVTQEYSSLAVRGLSHGCNSFLVDGANFDSTASRFEVHLVGETDEKKNEGSGNLPVLNEDLALALPYDETKDGVLTYRFWKKFVVPIPNGLKVGSYELWIMSGEDSTGGPDDFEVAALTLTACGVGSPTIPTEVS